MSGCQRRPPWWWARENHLTRGRKSCSVLLRAELRAVHRVLLETWGTRWLWGPSLFRGAERARKCASDCVARSPMAPAAPPALKAAECHPPIREALVPQRGPCADVWSTASRLVTAACPVVYPSFDEAGGL